MWTTKKVFANLLEVSLLGKYYHSIFESDPVIKEAPECFKPSAKERQRVATVRVYSFQAQLP